MSLTRSQKKYISQNINEKSTEEIALELGINESDIVSFKKSLKDNIDIKNDEFEVGVVEENQFEQTKYFNIYVFVSLFVLVFIVFANALGNRFVSDDIATILEDPSIKSINYIFAAPYATVQLIVKFLLYKVAGENPTIHRLANISLHGLSVGLVFLIFRNLYKSFFISLSVALLYAVHPLISEPVVWISGLPYSISTFLFLLTFFLYVKSKGINNLYYYASLVVFFLCVFTTEKALVLFIPIILIEYVYGNLGKSWKRLSPYVGLGLVALGLALYNISGRIGVLESQHNLDPGVVNPVLQVPIAITEYLILAFWPSALTLYHSEMTYTPTEYAIRAIIFGALVAIVTMSGILARGGVGPFLRFWDKKKKDPKIMFKVFTQNDFKYIFYWSVFSFVVLLPTLTPFKVSWLVAERYVYLAIIGVFAIISLGFKKLYDKDEYRPAVVVIFAILIMVLGIRTVYRNMDWKDPDTLWIATAKVSPSSPNAHNNLGDVYSRRGDLVGAAKEFARATELKPNYSDAYHNLALTYWNLSKLEQDTVKRETLMELSRQNYAMAIQQNPNLWQSYQNLGTTYYETGDYDKALQYLLAAGQINPSDVRIWLMLAVTYAKIGDEVKSNEIMSQLISLDPNNGQIRAVQEEINRILSNENEANPDEELLESESISP